MGKPSKQVMEFMEAYGVASDEIWEVHGNQWVVKHKALERIAVEKKITFDRPAIIEHDSVGKIAVVCVFAKMGDREEWSFGEAAPANNKNAYVFSMAEKRGKDRCILKLLNAHGALYSEDEADDFAKPRQNPHVTRAEDITDHQQEYDQNGQPIDNIPLASNPAAKLRVKDARPEYASLQSEMDECSSIVKLERWGKMSADSIAALPPEWQKILRGKYAEKLKQLREEIAA